jgi:hypothetical protein
MPKPRSAFAKGDLDAMMEVWADEIYYVHREAPRVSGV